MKNEKRQDSYVYVLPLHFQPCPVFAFVSRMARALHGVRRNVAAVHRVYGSESLQNLLVILLEVSRDFV
jgi:hypothetical protein